MSLQIRVGRIASIYLLWPLITYCLAAQTGSPPKTQPAKGTEAAGTETTGKDAQLHSCLERAAEAMHKGELPAAAEALRQALTIDPHSLAALNNLGIVLSREGKPAEAIPLYEEALKVRPDDAATKRNLAIAYF